MAPTSTLDYDSALDVKVVESARPVPGLMASTSDNCGNSCSGTACNTNVANPA
jgi:FxLD family lantipeptide